MGNYRRTKNEYLNNFYEQHGFSLNRDNIEDNPGLKNISKMFLIVYGANSVKGKIWEKQNILKIL